MRFKIFLITMTALYLTFMFQIGAFAADLNKVYVESGYSKNKISTEIGDFVSNGYDVSLGYEINNNLDIKIGYHDFGKDTRSAKFTSEYEEGYVRFGGYDSLDVQSISVGIKPKLNVNEYLSIYTEIGVHNWYAEYNLKADGFYNDETVDLNLNFKDSGYDGYAGIGVELEIGALRIGASTKSYSAVDIDSATSTNLYLGFSKKF